MKNSMKIGINSIVGLIFLLFSLFVLNVISKLPEGTSLAQSGPGFFPKVIIIIMLIVSVALIIKDLISNKEKSKFEINNDDEIKVVLLIIAIALYIFLLSKIGYVITTAILLIITFWLFGYRNKIKLISLSIATPIIINFVFKALLQVQLP